MNERLIDMLRALDCLFTGNNIHEKKQQIEIVNEILAKEYVSNQLNFLDKNRDNIPIVTFYTEGTYTLNGKKFIAKVKAIPISELKNEHKNNIHVMLKVCRAELNNMVTNLLAPDAYYFEIAANLARKSKNYELEIFICKVLISAYDIYVNARQKFGLDIFCDPRRSPRYERIVNRIPRAMDLYIKTK